ncbi:MAG: HlyD family efflux transporter periplasmic adaptor subunit [Devosia sp.]|nr:HlyD family efflux transporter periplasmic adaptor subunit [Devosia sp.]
METAAEPEVLEPALWQKLLIASDTAAFASAFVRLQALSLPGTTSAALFLVEQGRPVLSAAWPARGTEATRALAELAALVVAQSRTILRSGGKGSGHRLIGQPVEIDGGLVAVSVISVATEPGADDKETASRQVRQMQWGLAWLRDHLRATASGEVKRERDRSRATLEVLASVLEKEDFRSAGIAAATELALRFDCSRVSIGFTRFGSIRVTAISHSASFARSMQLVQQLGAAMDEAVDQRALIRFPPAPGDVVATHAHAGLAHAQRSANLLTIPLLVVDRFVGAVTFERAAGQPFEPALVQLLDVVITAIGPILHEKRRNDRWLVVKAGDALHTQLKRLLGPGHVWRKLFVAGLLASVLFFSLATDTYRVTANALVEGSERRSVVSAYDGYVQTASARAGDFVKAGDELASLEDRELNLERLRWEAEKQQHRYEYDRALAAREPANLNIIQSRIDQADSQLRLLDEQLARLRILAPFDGLLVSGDLSQRIGASVARGETLFELSPLTGYRVVMVVDERDIADLEVGQAGQVIFTSLPEQPFDITVEVITPVAVQVQGRNGFRVEAAIEGDLNRLRPGMTGVGKVAIEQEPLIAIWLHPILDWLRLTLWRWTA